MRERSAAAPVASRSEERYCRVERLVAEGEKILRLEYRKRGDEGLFEYLREWLVPDGGRIAFSAVATKSGRTPGAFRVALHRAHKRYRKIVQEQLALAA